MSNGSCSGCGGTAVAGTKCSSPSENYLNPVIVQSAYSNQTYVKDVAVDHMTIDSAEMTVMSPSANHLAQPIASSTVLMQQTNILNTPTSPTARLANCDQPGTPTNKKPIVTKSKLLSLNINHIY